MEDSKLLYSASMSLDGFIAGPGGDMSWLTPHLGSGPSLDELIAEIGSLLIGRRTFGGDDPNAGTDREGPFGGRYVNVLGADVARQCIDAGVLDEVLVFIAPQLLGDGVRLFDHPGGGSVRLDPIDPGSAGPAGLRFRVRV